MRNYLSAKRYSSEGQSSQLSDALLFAVGVMISVVFPSILMAIFFGSIAFVLFFVTTSLGVISGFALYVPRANASRQNELMGLLKSQHREFFDEIRSDVVRLLE